MIIALKTGISEETVQQLTAYLEQKNLTVHRSQGTSQTVLGLVGDTTRIDEEALRAISCVDKVLRVQEPYKKAHRAFHPDDTCIEVQGLDGYTRQIGGQYFGIIAGPCSVESEEQIIAIAKSVQKAGAHFLRGGAFKPRSSPYSFQGLGIDGLKLLIQAKQETGMPLVSELMDIQQLDSFESVDVIQIGARNMQNFTLLKEIGKCHKPILLKRGLANTITELLMAAEYIMAGGTETVLLCERGIRSFDSYTRNVLDISAVPALKKQSHLPVIVDPSHATGLSWMVPAMAKAALAAGADGIIVEVHNDPEHALCDGEQSITPTVFRTLVEKLRNYAILESRII
ncbi:MAG: 3-deoxy-7-phosphoheptulonate synthase [Treponema sp.]|jgi:3-deoxy-7-phosphoheptulonate synthase|nr:3-deoxy-7-phosphoheptulonate synthase [Treponema sp.]